MRSMMEGIDLGDFSMIKQTNNLRLINRWIGYLLQKEFLGPIIIDLEKYLKCCAHK